MRLILFALVMWLAAVIFALADPPPRYIIPERVIQGATICAEYTSASAPRAANRACVETATVQAWILANGRADECQ